MSYVEEKLKFLQLLLTYVKIITKPMPGVRFLSDYTYYVKAKLRAASAPMYSSMRMPGSSAVRLEA